MGAQEGIREKIKRYKSGDGIFGFRQIT